MNIWCKNLARNIMKIWSYYNILLIYPNPKGKYTLRTLGLSSKTMSSRKVYLPLGLG